MKILKNYTFTWWQMGIFKLCLLSLGVAIGSYFSEILLPYINGFIACAIAFGTYLAIIALKK